MRAPSPALTDVGALFRESWEIYQRRFSTLIGLFLLSVVAFALPAGAGAAVGVFAGMAGGGAVVPIAGLAGFLAGTYLGFRCFAGLLHAVADEGLDLKGALERGKGAALSLIWVATLVGFIITGGYLLLVIPGIVFTVWFCIAQFVLVLEDYRGMDALLKSREYTRGQWFNVALRLLLIWAASLLLGAIPLAGPILSLVFIPYVTIFHYLVYRDLRGLQGDVPFSCGMVDKLKWPGVALLGMVLVPVVLVSVIGLSVLGPLAQFASREGIGIEQRGVAVPPGANNDDGIRVITFPRDGLQPDVPAQSPEAQTVPPATEGAGLPLSSQTGSGEHPDDIHLFIYATNYTGTVKVNGTPIRDLEGKPDVQYNYNMDGRSLRYGDNQIEVDYAEVPSHHEGLLGVKIRASRYRSGGEKEVLGEYRFEEKGTGTRSFTLQVPR